ncbi:MAG: glycosyltransferase family 2 protein [Ignavibacteria bacterium]
MKDADASPLVSIVMPTYNRGHCIDRAIASVLDQDFPHWELIIVDNHSTDDTEAVVARFPDPRIRVLKIHNNGVIAASRNMGIRDAGGKYVAFLDSDDWWVGEKLSASVAALELGADVVYHDLHLITSLPAKVRAGKRARTWQVRAPVFRDLLRRGNALSNSSVVARRELLEKCGGFSEDPQLCMSVDFDGWLRLSRHTDAFVRIEAPLGFYWEGGGNETNPRRAISSSLHLQKTYYAELSEQFGDAMPYWMAYTLARGHHAERDFGRAAHYAKRSLQRGVPPLVALKALVTLGSALVQGAFARNPSRLAG